MAAITFQWNPFQERVDNDIKREVIKVNATDTRFEFVPRYAPFFSGGPTDDKTFKLYRQGSTTPLILGVDYAFAHPFNQLVLKNRRNVFGSVVLLKKIDAVLEASYSTIGGPFTLDDAAFAQLVANIVNSPRQADWSDLDPVTIPTEWPADPHTHPATQTYDYLEMYTALNSLVLVMMSVNGIMDVQKMLEEHLNKPLIEAHPGTKEDLGLEDVENMAPATNEDLKGNSANKSVTVAVLKEAFRQQAAGTLNIN
jgi:hypothetical protein